MMFLISLMSLILQSLEILRILKIVDRGAFQEHLKILDNINLKYSDCIASKFTITLGDEFQGLLTTGNNIMEIIQYIKRNLSRKNKIWIGIGSISTKINSEISIGADGPGYYKARESIETLKI